MFTRREALLASAILVGGALPAAAQPHHPGQQKAGAHGGKKDMAAGSPADTPLGPVDTAARWAFIMDFATGATLLEKDADTQMPPSSMTKLMTIYLVYERLKQGKMKLDDELAVSERAWRMGGSKMFVQLGTQVRVEDLIRGVIVQSGNDACIVFAEAIAGSEEQFADLMNQKAKELGLTNSYFKNATGWPDPEQHMSCRDIATLARRIILDFPEYYHYDAEKTFKYNNIEQGNRNPLVQKGTADGLKTGHTEAGGYGLAASSKRGDRRVIVVLNGLEFDAPAGRGGRAVDGLGVRELRGRDAVCRGRRDRACAGVAWFETDCAVGRWARPHRHDAAQLAEECVGEGELRLADPRACREGHDSGEAGGGGARCAEYGGAAAGWRRCRKTQSAGTRHRCAVALCDGRVVERSRWRLLRRFAPRNDRSKAGWPRDGS